jgi:hypothetical protein
MSTRREADEVALWAVALLSLWGSDPCLREEFDSIVSLDWWAHELVEALIRSAFAADES